jgi:hypothetical protein
VAVQRNTIHVTGLARGEDVVLLASPGLGATPVPGCPGLTVPLLRPLVLGLTRGDAAGAADLSLPVPANAAGRPNALVAVSLETCRVSPIRLVTFAAP